MSFRPTVSYLVTLYNKVPYLRHLLAGLAAQEGNFDRQFIFVDDGSTDDTLALCRHLTRDWQRVTIVTQPNAGPAVAMNRGLALAEGAYVKPVDGDDILAPWATQYLLDALARTGCDVAYAQVEIQGRYDPILSEWDIQKSPLNPVIMEDFVSRTIANSQTIPSSWLCARSLARAVGGSDEGVFVQDYSFELRLARAGRFVRLDNAMFLQPALAPGRLSDDEAQTLHDVNLALVRFALQHPDLPEPKRRAIVRRTASRAWRWARRHGGGHFLSPSFNLHSAARLELTRKPTPSFGDAVCAPFRESSPIRLMQDPRELFQNLAVCSPVAAGSNREALQRYCGG